MAQYINPTFKITGEGTDITAMSESLIFSLDTKIEKTFEILDTTLPVNILTYENISDLKLIILEGTGDFTIRFTHTSSTMITEIPVITGFPFILPTNQTLIEDMDSIEIVTASTTEIKISYRAYGEDIPVVV